MRNPILIIAEAGVNHNGNLDQAKQLIDVAAQAGADLVKFQTFNADRLVTPEARKATYQLQGGESSGTQYEMLKDLELSPEMHEELIRHCTDSGIEFFSTGFDQESNEMLYGLGFRRFKIPSGEITNLPYLQHIGKFALPLILSSGMSTMSEIDAALGVLEEAGTPRKLVTVLHCTSQYPTPMSDVNLRAMVSIREFLGVDVGYSDHTLGIEVSIAAAALGAVTIEKHFTLDRTSLGPDHKASIEPRELNEMVKAIRNIEIALGNAQKCPSPRELKMRELARRSIVASTDIAIGQTFSLENVTVKRPGIGISPMDLETVLGQPALRDFDRDEAIEL